MVNDVKRRTVLAGLGAGVVAAAVPGSAMALTTAEARRLIDDVVSEITRVINSGGSESRMLTQFERIFDRFANTAVIAIRVLGADARSASQAQLRDFTVAFRRYIARKYGRRFREFIGGRIEVDSARAVKSWHEVQTTAHLQGEAPFRIDFLVKEAGGRNLFFDMVIEGISLTKVEREEIGAMLDRRRGNLDQLISDLRNTG
ncbi:phospholipid-binding protein MlaC [Pseudohalocynthiibacter aestuariivivens]|jgi:phospholipid transport system substrate-binding protein|uniref:Phospholipid-binding protein MlaC n=1 Tax=Pseudohalocynthiibacter aestuariivivens TaxID=1591409 RepID=A0ABV5JHE8_9RHOB|nr:MULTISPECIES: ABC transporter substrate-binding protein [Pseudohalocynthiibacter]MBS9715408.1 ABC transporter substrate-binding protein [Pseudohalocynthiibacter aestuariivivens]MCK0102646.1 ABC transporter substrate-binding protein [Pseudohalocynthiibacter sp. F2068]